MPQVLEQSVAEPAAGAGPVAPALRVRWLQPHPEGGTQRDRMLADLKAPLDGSQEVRDLRGIRLVGEDLSGLDLSRVDFSGADLSGADLSGSRLIGSVLRRTILCEAKLTRCEFLNADLSGSDLSECVAESAGFGGTDLTGCKLFHANFANASFSHAVLSGADLRTANLQGARLREADLSHCDFSRADLRGAELDRSDVRSASFAEVDLRNARARGLSGFDSADWIGADIQDVNFCGAYLLRRTITDQNYLHEFRGHSRFHAALHWVWWITSDCGRSFVRWGLWTIFLMTVFGAVYQWVALDYGAHPTFLSPFYYSVVTLTTLGYGDVLPASPAAQIVAMIEVTLGYVMLGGLLSIFSNKMTRRAE